MITWGKYYWPIALIVVSVAMFGIPELIALFTNQANTLSQYSWDELHVSGIAVHNVAWLVSLIVWLVFVVVITLHIWWRSW
jgi:dolichyl-phosphate-mannose--protein O-mannosyl transferase